MNHLEELTTIIRHEAELTEHLEGVLKTKQQAFIHWKPEELETVLQKEISFLHGIAELESKRIALVRELQPQTKSPTLTSIIMEHASSELQAQAERLKNASQNVLRQNEQSRRLLTSSLSFVQNTLSILTNNFQRKLLDQKI